MRLLLVLLLAMIMASCAGTRRDYLVAAPDAPVWPHPPEIARLRYVSSIEKHTDLFQSGNFLTRTFNRVVGEQDTRMVRPYAVALHPDGGLLVADPGMSCVHFYDSSRRRYRAIGSQLEGGLPSPVGIVATADGMILVSDSRRRTVEQFSPDGRSHGRFGRDHEFQRPGGIAIHPVTNEVFVVDILSHSIVVFSADGKRQRVMGGNGLEPGMFNFPTHLGFDDAGNLIVADSMNFRIQLLAPDGHPLAAYGETGNARGNFARPKGVASIGGDVYVAMEGLFDALVFFNREGELLMSVGEAGSDPGQFWLAAGLAVDHRRQLLFVADTYNSRVQVFEMPPPPAAGGEAP